MAALPARSAPGAPARRPAPRRREAPTRRPPARTAASRKRGAAVLDALLHGHGWIALVFLLLAGIVFFNVDLLQMNRDIAGMSQKASAVKRQNARLRTDLARLGSSERIQQVAARAGLVLPAPGEVRYLRASPRVDAVRAARRIASEQSSAAQGAPRTPPSQLGEGAGPVSAAPGQ
jgi:cell division protein FtsL